MEYDVAKIIRTAKRLQEATGYLELGMTQHSLDSLDGLEDAGPLEAEVAALRRRARRLQLGYDDTAVSLQEPAEQEPTSKADWLTLSLCYHLSGDVQQAIQALAHARGAHLPRPE
jgi:tetratricopeptide (TPR) repeat protein